MNITYSCTVSYLMLNVDTFDRRHGEINNVEKAYEVRRQWN